MSKRQERCETCRWIGPIDRSDEQRECRRFPPRIDVASSDRYWCESVREPDEGDPPTAPEWIALRGLWPLIDQGDFCGEWQPAPPAAAATDAGD